MTNTAYKLALCALVFGSLFGALSNSAALADSLSDGNSPPMLLAFDGFDDDGDWSETSDDGPASDEPDDEMMDGESATNTPDFDDPDADPGYSVGFDPDKE